MATVTNPKRALAVFQRTDHFGMPQAAFNAVIPAIAAAANHQPVAVRNQDLPETVGCEGSVVGGVQVGEVWYLMKRRPERIAHQHFFVGANPQAPGGILCDTLPWSSGH